MEELELCITAVERVVGGAECVLGLGDVCTVVECQLTAYGDQRGVEGQRRVVWKGAGIVRVAEQEDGLPVGISTDQCIRQARMLASV